MPGAVSPLTEGFPHRGTRLSSSLLTKGFRLVIRMKHRSVRSGILLAAAAHSRHFFLGELEHERKFAGLSINLLLHGMAKRFQRIYLSISGYVPDFDEESGFWKAVNARLVVTLADREVGAICVDDRERSQSLWKQLVAAPMGAEVDKVSYRLFLVFWS